MRMFMCVLVCSLLGCAGGYLNPTAGWMVNKHKPTVCFRKAGGVGHWDTCKYLDSQEKIDCQGNALILHDGEILAPGTKLSLYGHMMNSESMVLATSGDFANDVFYCPADQIRKF